MIRKNQTKIIIEIFTFKESEILELNSWAALIELI